MNVKIILLCLIFLLVCGHGSVMGGKDVYPGLSITAEPTSGTAPLTVDFTAGVTDPYGGQFPVTFDWYFDDGGASTRQNPQHTYTAGGTYTALCRATFWRSPKITVQGVVDIQITGILPLNLSVSADPTSGNAPLTVNFTSTVTGGVGSINYQWDFGDTSSSTQANPSHTFTGGGTFTVTCTVTDSASPPRTVQATVDIDVIESHWPVAVSTAPGSQYAVQIAPDGSGGALMAWHDQRGGTYNDIYAQRLDASGNTLWTANGAPVCTAALDQYKPQLIADGAGGAIVTWCDSRSGSWDIYAQRVTQDGTLE
jgi:PKD repeat protein